MSLSSRAALLALSCALVWPSVARADAPPQAPTLEQVEAARAPFKEARELHRQGRLNEAIAKMLDAYQIATTPVIALEAGRLLVEAGRLVTARELLRGVATLPTSPRESEAGRDARRDSAALAAQLDLRIPKIVLTDRTPGLEVLLDGKPFAFAEGAAGQAVDPGGHALTLSVEGQVCASLAVPLGEGESRTLDLRDAARACRPAPAPAPAAVASVPAAAVAVESPRPARGSAFWPWGGVALAGAGAIAAGASMYVLFHAKSDYDSVSSGCSASGCDSNAYDVRHNAHDQANVATVVAGVGAAALAGGLLWVVLGRPSSSAASAPRVGLGPTSVSLSVPLH